MNINNWIKESHQIAQSKGFYDCDECGGKGIIESLPTQGDYIHPDKETCYVCNGTGKKDRDISELIALTIEELYEVQRAHREGMFTDFTSFYVDFNFQCDIVPEKERFIMAFEENIKDTFEDECADVLIRLFDIMGYYGYEYNKDYADTGSITLENSFFENILMFNAMLIGICDDVCSKYDRIEEVFTQFIAYFLYFCKEQNVDIETHINLKMRYNRTREYKHGKNY